MSDLRCTVLSDGPSDIALLPILTWLLSQYVGSRSLDLSWADFRRLNRPPRALTDRVLMSINLFPCDLLFVHRDAEGATRQARVDEIVRAREQALRHGPVPPVICVVPVRMTEAWLLSDEKAVRQAAGNPNGRQPLALPRVHELEAMPDPKATLRQLWREASDLRGQRLKRLRVAPDLLAGFIDDFSVLRGLPAFQALEADIERVTREAGWQS